MAFCLCDCILKITVQVNAIVYVLLLQRLPFDRDKMSSFGFVNVVKGLNFNCLYELFLTSQFVCFTVPIFISIKYVSHMVYRHNTGKFRSGTTCIYSRVVL